MFEGLFQPAHLLIVTLPILLLVLPLWKVLVKAGYPGPISLLALVPFGIFVIGWWLAFSEWPVERAAKRFNGLP